LSGATYCIGSGCNPVGGITWPGTNQVNLGPVASGMSQTLRIVAKVMYQPSGGSLSNTATVTSDSTDSNSANNSSNVMTPVNLRTTTTSVSCTPIPQQINMNVTCTATVTDIDAHPTKAPPTGTVTFSNAGAGDSGVFQSPNYA